MSSYLAGLGKDEFGTDYSGLFKALSHVNYNVRLAAADALAAVLDEYPDTIQVANSFYSGCVSICESSSYKIAVFSGIFSDFVLSIYS